MNVAAGNVAAARKRADERRLKRQREEDEIL
jgi:hypothetical protein